MVKPYWEKGIRRCALLFLVCQLWLCVCSGLQAAVAQDLKSTQSAQAMNAYNNKQYAQAIPLLKLAVQNNPRSVPLIFHLGMAHIHLKQYEPARQYFETVTHLLPQNHPTSLKARNNIRVITRQQITLASNADKAGHVFNTSFSSKSKANYLTDVLYQGKVIRFSTHKMPLKVYISSGASVPGWNEALKQSVLFAMSTWQSASHNQLRFTRTYREEYADIVVRWQRNFRDGVLGISPFEVVGGTLVRSDVNLALYDGRSGQPLSAAMLNRIALHEFGHAIGLRGHSPYPEDIMHYSENPQQTVLSMRDRNTLAMLYKLEADVQNNTQSSTVQTKTYYTLFTNGLTAQKNNRKELAMRYYRQAIALNPSFPEAKFNLGALLIAQGNQLAKQQQFKAAHRSFAEAVKLYEALSRLAKPPANTDRNLQAARQNLSVMEKVSTPSVK